MIIHVDLLYHTHDEHNDHESVISQIKATKIERTKSNKKLMDEKINSDKMVGLVVDGGGDSDNDEDEDRESKVVVPLERPKGLPMLPNLSGLNKNKRSLFSSVDL